MLKLLLLTFTLLIFSACNEDKPKQSYDAKKLLETKCATCHETSMPPIISDDELAPPMMAIAFHMKDFMQTNNDSERIPMAIEFVIDYVLYPSLEKSYCDKESIKRYGLMPSQKGNVTKGEVKAIATYMFNHFTQENLTKDLKAQLEYNALAPGKKIALKYKCMGCHKVNRKVIGPSFIDIAKKFQKSEKAMQDSITQGSKTKWKDSKGAIMPSFKQINSDELKVLSAWILKTGK